MFKELVLFVHGTVKNVCLRPPVTTVFRGGQRMPIHNCLCANIIFFVAIFAPLYVCLLQDVIAVLRDFNLQIVKKGK